MSDKEAIKLIQGIEEDGRNITSEHVEALKLAIKALERDTDDLSEYSYKYKLWQKAYERGKSEARPQGKLIIKNHMETCGNCDSVMPMMNDYYRAKLRGCPYCLTEFTNLADMGKETENETN